MAEDLVKVAAPDGAVGEVDGLTGRRYKAQGGGMYEMTPSDARALREIGGFAPNVGGRVRRGGYVCDGCGFRAVVRTCSRCGLTGLRREDEPPLERPHETHFKIHKHASEPVEAFVEGLGNGRGWLTFMPRAGVSPHVDRMLRTGRVD